MEFCRTITKAAQLTLADGAVRFISQDIDPAILNALLTANGGEKVPEF